MQHLPTTNDPNFVSALIEAEYLPTETKLKHQQYDIRIQAMQDNDPHKSVLLKKRNDLENKNPELKEERLAKEREKLVNQHKLKHQEYDKKIQAMQDDDSHKLVLLRQRNELEKDYPELKEQRLAKEREKLVNQQKPIYRRINMKIASMHDSKHEDSDKISLLEQLSDLEKKYPELKEQKLAKENEKKWIELKKEHRQYTMSNKFIPQRDALEERYPRLKELRLENETQREDQQKHERKTKTLDNMMQDTEGLLWYNDREELEKQNPKLKEKRVEFYNKEEPKTILDRGKEVTSEKKDAIAMAAFVNDLKENDPKALEDERRRVKRDQDALKKKREQDKLNQKNEAHAPGKNTTTPCVHYLRGNCKYGKHCKFDHPPLRSGPQSRTSKQGAEGGDKIKQNPIKYWYKIGMLPVNADNSNDTTACTFFLQGRCKKGEKCKFAHPAARFGSQSRTSQQREAGDKTRTQSGGKHRDNIKTQSVGGLENTELILIVDIDAEIYSWKMTTDKYFTIAYNDSTDGTLVFNSISTINSDKFFTSKNSICYIERQGTTLFRFECKKLDPNTPIKDLKNSEGQQLHEDDVRLLHDHKNVTTWAEFQKVKSFGDTVAEHSAFLCDSILEHNLQNIVFKGEYNEAKQRYVHIGSKVELLDKIKPDVLNTLSIAIYDAREVCLDNKWHLVDSEIDNAWRHGTPEPPTVRTKGFHTAKRTVSIGSDINNDICIPDTDINTKHVCLIRTNNSLLVYAALGNSWKNVGRRAPVNGIKIKGDCTMLINKLDNETKGDSAAKVNPDKVIKIIPQEKEDDESYRMTFLNLERELTNLGIDTPSLTPHTYVKVKDNYYQPKEDYAITSGQALKVIGKHKSLRTFTFYNNDDFWEIFGQAVKQMNTHTVSFGK